MSTSERAEPGLRFRLFGVPVRLDPSFFIIALLFSAQRLSGASGWHGVASWLIALLLSLLVHEFGHAIAFRLFKLQPSITLYSMGGLTFARGRLTWGRSLVTSLSGPFAGLAFGGLVWLAREVGLWSPRSLFEFVFFDDLLFINLLWGLVNLLPLHPLDGGQSFEAVLHLLKVKHAARKTAIVSIVTAAGGAVYGLYVNRIFLVLLAGYLGWTNWQRLQDMPAPRSGPSAAA